SPDPAASCSSTLSLHDALPISDVLGENVDSVLGPDQPCLQHGETCGHPHHEGARDQEIKCIERIAQFFCSIECFHSGLPTVMNKSEEHTSELQSRENLVCRLLL